jgi:hypothetical protein
MIRITVWDREGISKTYEMEIIKGSNVRGRVYKPGAVGPWWRHGLTARSLKYGSVVAGRLLQSRVTQWPTHTKTETLFCINRDTAGGPLNRVISGWTEQRLSYQFTERMRNQSKDRWDIWKIDKEQVQSGTKANDKRWHVPMRFQQNLWAVSVRDHTSIKVAT